MLSFKVYVAGIPASKGSYRPVNGKTKTGKRVTRLIPMDKKEKPWRESIVKAVRATSDWREFREESMGKRLHVTYDFRLPKPKTVTRYQPTVKPDIDKLVRCVNDALTDSGLIEDDSRIVGIAAEKHYAECDNQGVNVFIQAEDNGERQ